MSRLRRLVAERHWILATTAAGGFAYAALASLTRPFTVEADVATALPLFAAVLTMAVRVRITKRPESVMHPNCESQRVPRSNRWSLMWVTMAIVIACWELYTYMSSPRSEHPTLSTLIDLLDSTRTGKFSAFALWLALGCYLVLK
jgi:hypothetical protein